jgi:hypothetical protein
MHQYLGHVLSAKRKKNTDIGISKKKTKKKLIIVIG